MDQPVQNNTLPIVLSFWFCPRKFLSECGLEKRGIMKCRSPCNLKQDGISHKFLLTLFIVPNESVLSQFIAPLLVAIH